MNETSFLLLNKHDAEYSDIVSKMQLSVRNHKKSVGGVFSSYNVISIQKIHNKKLWKRYQNRKQEINEDNGSHNEKILFHGSAALPAILKSGFDERYASNKGMFGAGIYFAEHSSKSNQYVYGVGGGDGCRRHRDRSCYLCERQMLLCRVLLGRTKCLKFPKNGLSHAPPGYHSITGEPTPQGLMYPEYVVYRGEQAFPEYLLTYKLVDPNETNCTSAASRFSESENFQDSSREENADSSDEESDDGSYNANYSHSNSDNDSYDEGERIHNDTDDEDERTHNDSDDEDEIAHNYTDDNDEDERTHSDSDANNEDERTYNNSDDEDEIAHNYTNDNDEDERTHSDSDANNEDERTHNDSDDEDEIAHNYTDDNDEDERTHNDTDDDRFNYDSDDVDDDELFIRFPTCRIN